MATLTTAICMATPDTGAHRLAELRSTKLTRKRGQLADREALAARDARDAAVAARKAADEDGEGGGTEAHQLELTQKSVLTVLTPHPTSSDPICSAFRSSVSDVGLGPAWSTLVQLGPLWSSLVHFGLHES
jgi:hypothetical protein